ncbi:MAG TPA: hypothetical protein VK116_12200, partial [Planctomycetota bacterium]|nr:hypothetical protein [Planctomycetota bacterium]
MLGRSVLLDHMRADALGFLESKHYGAALALADEAIALHAGFLPAHEIRLEALRLGEGPQAAEAAARELIERFPRHFAFRRELARSLLDQARYDEALDALSGRTPRAAIAETSYLRALIYASAGIDAEALIELEASARAGLSSIERVKDEPVFASLRGLERFEGVVARIAVNHDEIERRRSDPPYGLDLGREERFSLPAEDLIERLEHAMQTGLRREVRYELDDLRGGKLRSDDRKDRFQVIFFWSHWSAAA